MTRRNPAPAVSTGDLFAKIPPRADRTTKPAPPTQRVIDLLASGFLDERDGRAIEYVNESGHLRQIRRVFDNDDELEERWHGDGEVGADTGGDENADRWGEWGTMGFDNGERIGPGLTYPDLFRCALALTAAQVIDDNIPPEWDYEALGVIARDPIEERWRVRA